MAENTSQSQQTQINTMQQTLLMKESMLNNQKSEILMIQTQNKMLNETKIINLNEINQSHSKINDLNTTLNKINSERKSRGSIPLNLSRFKLYFRNLGERSWDVLTRHLEIIGVKFPED